MQVVKSRFIGYCHGVSDTIKKAESVVKMGRKKGVPYYSIGRLIHNTDVVNYFESLGLKVIDSPDVKPGIALVRAHGIPDALRESFIQSHFELVDSTCANIQKSRKIMKAAVKNGRTVIVLGVENHAETVCLQGIGGVESFLVSSEQQLEQLFASVPRDRAVCVITQTTFPENLYDCLMEKLVEHYSDIQFGNKLCQACISRKKNALELAQSCDATVVVGGRDSENTKDLALWIKRSGKPVIFVENAGDINAELDKCLSAYSKVGVCSGTSTPVNVIDEVVHHLESL